MANMFSNSEEGLWPTKTTCFPEGTESMSAPQHINGTATAMSFSLVSKTACCLTWNRTISKGVSILDPENVDLLCSRVISNQKMFCILPVVIRLGASNHGSQSHKINHGN